MDAGINCTIHQDTPYVSPNIILTMYNAVNRNTKTGRLLGENQRITIKQAIEAVTINAAYQIYEETTKGSLEEGKVADIVVLNKNPLQINASELKKLKILEPWKKGEVIYKARA